MATTHQLPPLDEVLNDIDISKEIERINDPFVKDSLHSAVQIGLPRDETLIIVGRILRFEESKSQSETLKTFRSQIIIILNEFLSNALTAYSNRAKEFIINADLKYNMETKRITEAVGIAYAIQGKSKLVPDLFDEYSAVIINADDNLLKKLLNGSDKNSFMGTIDYLYSMSPNTALGILFGVYMALEEAKQGKITDKVNINSMIAPALRSLSNTLTTIRL